jgi:hypothetical protein
MFHSSGPPAAGSGQALRFWLRAAYDKGVAECFPSLVLAHPSPWSRGGRQSKVLVFAEPAGGQTVCTLIRGSQSYLTPRDQNFLNEINYEHQSGIW